MDKGKKTVEQNHPQQVKMRLDQVSPTFCLAKWKQVTLHLHNGHTQSCHHVKSHQVKTSDLDNPTALHNTPFKMETRRQMLKGEWPKECDYCQNLEQVGELSDRSYKSSYKWAKDYFAEVVESKDGPNILPSFVEVSFENTCQFKCMYCGPNYSSRWAQEIEIYGAYPTYDKFNSFEASHVKLQKQQMERKKYIEAFWNWIPDLSKKLQHLRVTGGEPFLSDETFKLIDFLIDNPRPNLIFSINTNMGFSESNFLLFTSKIKKLQSSVKKVIVFTSIDTVGEQAEYIRYGLKYKKFVGNVEKLLNLSSDGFHLSFMITVNNLSIFKFKDLLKWILELRKNYRQHTITIDTPYLRHPEFMSVMLLPHEFCGYLEEVINFMQINSSNQIINGFAESEIQMVDRILQFKKSNPFSERKRVLLMRDFYSYYSEYDKRRGENLISTFPEIKSFWQDCEYLKKTAKPVVGDLAYISEKLKDSSFSEITKKIKDMFIS